ncbi:MAG: FAD-binding protein, partial [Patescibacteria group bacterium]
MFSIRRNVPLAPLTTFHVGGKAQYYIRLSCPLELAEAIEYAEKNNLPAYILGGGSNVLFSDNGFPGLVIHLVGGGITVTGNRIHAAAGASLDDVIDTARKNSLGGIEKLSGIPGSFGGAVRGNAGAFGAEIGDVLTRVKAMDKTTGMVIEYTKAECHFGYRASRFKKDDNLVILSADLLLSENADESELRRVAKETLRKREAKHP